MENQIMIRQMSCPICKEKIYSEIGKGCKMCGMVLVDGSKEFCSSSCKRQYNKIRDLSDK